MLTSSVVGPLTSTCRTEVPARLLTTWSRCRPAGTLSNRYSPDSLVVVARRRSTISTSAPATGTPAAVVTLPVSAPAPAVCAIAGTEKRKINTETEKTLSQRVCISIPRHPAKSNAGRRNVERWFGLRTRFPTNGRFRAMTGRRGTTAAADGLAARGTGSDSLAAPGRSSVRRGMCHRSSA
jgi:hypothetical protein